MELLGNTAKTLTLHAIKRDRKQKEFREYLADKGLVLAIVKCNI